MLMSVNKYANFSSNENKKRHKKKQVQMNSHSGEHEEAFWYQLKV